jgi:hypothetical protein
MESQERPSTLSRRDQLREAAAAKSSQFVEELVAEVGGTTVTTLQSRFDLWPGVRTTESEPLACLQAARELEHAAHLIQRGYIRQAREADNSWYEIGQALDLLWHAVVSNESMADEAYDYALRYNRPTAAIPPYTWTCQACQQIITDHGPWPLRPEQQEEGHSSNCPRWNHRLEVWRRHNRDCA